MTGRHCATRYKECHWCTDVIQEALASHVHVFVTTMTPDILVTSSLSTVDMNSGKAFFTYILPRKSRQKSNFLGFLFSPLQFQQHQERLLSVFFRFFLPHRSLLF